MTTIAWDGHTLAADRRGCSEAGKYVEVGPKVLRTADGRLIAAAGQSARCRSMLEWLSKPAAERDPAPAWQNDNDKWVSAFEIMPDGEVRMHMPDGWARLEAAFDAMGSGAHFAIGAMACGKTAAEAVAIAARFDTGTGGRIDVLELHEPEPFFQSDEDYLNELHRRMPDMPK